MHFFRNGEEFYPFLERAIEAATSEVLINVYSFHNDPVGERFLSLLKRKARDGVRVRLLFDGIGSWGDQRELVCELRAAGGDVRIFRPYRWYLARHPVSFLYRDHARIFLIDRKLFGLGGLGIGEIYRTREDFFLVTPVIHPEPLVAFFDELWRLASEWRDGGKCAAVSGSGIARGMTTLASGPHAGEDSIYRRLLGAVGQASRRVTIVTAWFFPPQELLDALVAAHRRGVEVTIVTPLQTDRLRYDGFRALPMSRLLGCGIRWYGVDRYFHQKFFIVDDAWCMGSANCDVLSLRRDYELGVAGERGPLLAELERNTARLTAEAEFITVHPLPFIFRKLGGLLYGLLEFFFTAGWRPRSAVTPRLRAAATRARS